MFHFFRTVIFIGGFIVLSTCADEPQKKPSSFRIEFSNYESTGWAEGELTHQNYFNLPLTYQIDTSYVIPGSVNIKTYKLHVRFSNEESMNIHFKKHDEDLNYHYPPQELSNSIFKFTLNGNTIELIDATLSLQPVEEDNTFTAVLNIHTLENGTINGTIYSLPFIKK